MEDHVKVMIAIGCEGEKPLLLCGLRIFLVA